MDVDEDMEVGSVKRKTLSVKMKTQPMTAISLKISVTKKLCGETLVTGKNTKAKNNTTVHNNPCAVTPQP